MVTKLVEKRLFVSTFTARIMKCKIVYIIYLIRRYGTSKYIGKGFYPFYFKPKLLYSIVQAFMLNGMINSDNQLYNQSNLMTL